MELEKYNDLTPQEQVLVSLYLKSMNKTQSAHQAGYSSTAVFNSPPVKAAIAEGMRTRAKRLRVGADWVLMQLVRVYDRCMEKQKVCDIYGHPTGEYKWDSKGALTALNSIGKHVDVKAFDPKEAQSQTNEDLVQQLIAGRQRVEQALPEPEHVDVLPPYIEDADLPLVIEPDFTIPVEPDQAPAGQEDSPIQESSRIPNQGNDSEPELSDAEKLEALLQRWRVLS